MYFTQFQDFDPVMYFTQFQDFHPYRTCKTDASFD